jgi:hypothetical protein
VLDVNASVGSFLCLKILLCYNILIILVNDSEYSDFTSQKPIQWHGCIYLVFRGATESVFLWLLVLFKARAHAFRISCLVQVLL